VKICTKIQEYNTNYDRATANRLLEELTDQRKQKWEKTVESTNFIYSSRKAWSVLRKLGTKSAVKFGKAAGFDYVHTEFIKNSGQRAKEWIVTLFNDILTSGKIPKLFKRAKVITILKPGRDGSDPWHFYCSVSFSRYLSE
jgi:hypothetical protein